MKKQGHEKFLFLDIDGVVTNQSANKPPIPLGDIASIEVFDPVSVASLNTLIEKLDPIVIIHSTRRFQFTAAEVEKGFKANGVRDARLEILPAYGESEGVAFDGPNEEKSFDIREHVHRRKIKDFVVLDDESLDVPRLVLVKGRLTKADVESVMRLFGK